MIVFIPVGTCGLSPSKLLIPNLHRPMNHGMSQDEQVGYLGLQKTCSFSTLQSSEPHTPQQASHGTQTAKNVSHISNLKRQTLKK